MWWTYHTSIVVQLTSVDTRVIRSKLLRVLYFIPAPRVKNRYQVPVLVLVTTEVQVLVLRICCVRASKKGVESTLRLPSRKDTAQHSPPPPPSPNSRAVSIGSRPTTHTRTPRREDDDDAPRRRASLDEDGWRRYPPRVSASDPSSGYVTRGCAQGGHQGEAHEGDNGNGNLRCSFLRCLRLQGRRRHLRPTLRAPGVGRRLGQPSLVR